MVSSSSHIGHKKKERGHPPCEFPFVEARLGLSRRAAALLGAATLGTALGLTGGFLLRHSSEVFDSGAVLFYKANSPTYPLVLQR